MIRHHPHESTLAEFAAGTLDEGRSLVVATHVAMCPVCRKFLAALEHAGGQWLEQADPVSMSGGAKERALSCLAEIDTPTKPQASGDALSRYRLDDWRWVGPGIHRRAVDVPSDNGTRVFFLKAAPGMTMPRHRHVGTELTLVLTGAFVHQGGRYTAGDFDDADHNDEHDPVIEGGAECVCLVAMQGYLRLNSLLGRLIEPFIRL